MVTKSQPLTASLVLVCSAFLTIATALADDVPSTWPQWRGPNRNGQSLDKGLLKAWPESGPKQIWKVTDIGTGYSTVSISDGLIYITGLVELTPEDKDTSRLFLTAITLDGKVKWRKDLCKAYIGSYRGARATPTCHNGNLYLQSGEGDLGCYDAKTGETKWTRNSEEFAGKHANWGYTESILIIDDLVIVTPGGEKTFMVALDKNTGKTVWQSKPYGYPHYSSPIHVVYKGVSMIITGARNGLIAVDTKTGNILWTHEFAPGNVANVPDPAFSDGYVFWSVGYGKGAVCLKLSVEGDKVTANEAWQSEDMICHHGGYVILDGHIYGNHKSGWTCLELKTGEKKWYDDGVGKGSLCYADGMLYLLGEKKGQVGLAEATPQAFKLTGSFSIEGEGPSWAHPVVNDGRLYLRYHQNLYCFDVKATGKDHPDSQQ
jgi:outer membrane protein assembly factor BamB